MTIITLQASLIHRPAIPQLRPISLSRKPPPRISSKISPEFSLFFCRKRLNDRLGDAVSLRSRYLRHSLVSSCTLNQENVDSASDPISSDFQTENPDIIEVSNGQVSVLDENPASGEEVEGDVKKNLPIMVFFMGIFTRLKNGIEKFLYSDWFSWWPFWRQEKRLERLIAEADANPKDAAKQTELLVELNKHSPESVIQRFDQRAHAVDSRGVAEYLRALVATNAIAEYLPDEQSGKPSSLPSLLQELKQRASGNMDEPFVSPGVSEKQPLHVVMVRDTKSLTFMNIGAYISCLAFLV